MGATANGWRSSYVAPTTKMRISPATSMPKTMLKHADISRQPRQSSVQVKRKNFEGSLGSCSGTPDHWVHHWIPSQQVGR